MAMTILITGANRGIGLALAKAACEGGHRVIATARSPGASPELEALTRHKGCVEIRGLDVTDLTQIEALAAAEKNPIDLLICNAGQFLGRGSIDDPDYTPEAWAQMMAANVAGPFFAVRSFLPHLERAGGKVAIISSIMGSHHRAPGGSYIYRASKAAATNLARNLATDLKARGVAVGAYHPGWVRTDMGGDAADISVEESAAGLMERFALLTLQTTGVVEDYKGDPIPF